MDPGYHARRAFAVLVSTVVVACAAPAAAQYMYLDANGDGVHTSADVFPPGGTDTLDVWLVTDHNRDGSPAVCAQDAAAAMTINSYTFILRATGGTAAWSGFQNHIPEFTLDAGGGSNGIEYWVGRASGTILPPGTYRLASVTATATSGLPSFWIASVSSSFPHALTSFGCQCVAGDFDNTMKLGSDWFDTDGVTSGPVGNHVPVLAQLVPMAVPEGTVGEQTLHASDADGQALTFSAEAAPEWVAVTTTAPGAGTASGLVRATPGYTDAGGAAPIILVSDGVSQDGAVLSITVSDVNRPPVLTAEDMTVEEGGYAEQEISATDPDFGQVELRLISGPVFCRLTRVGSYYGITRGTVIVEPGYEDAGSYRAVFDVADGLGAAQDSIAITVPEGNRPPIVTEDLGTVTVAVGTLRSVDVPATDPEGGLLEFSKSSGPGYMTVLTIEPGPGTGLGRVELRPGRGDGNGYGLVRVSDGVKSSSAALSIEVVGDEQMNIPPVLDPIADMVAVEGGSALQAVHASDPDGFALTLTPMGFPAYMSLETQSTVPSNAIARIVLAPRQGDAGRIQVAVRAFDGQAAVEDPFLVTVLEPGAGSTMLLVHREPEPADEWGTLQFRAGEGDFWVQDAGGFIEFSFLPPEPPSNGTAWGPDVQLACTPAQRPRCISDRINYWRLGFQPPLGRPLTVGVYEARPAADSTHARFTASMGYCTSYIPPSSTMEIRQIEHGPDGSITSFWAVVRHEPDALWGLFTVEARFNARLPVSIDAPSRVQAHANAPLEIPLRIGGYAPGLPSVTSPDLPDGASLVVMNDSTAVFRWTPGFEDKGVHPVRFVAELPGFAPDTSLMTSCVDIPGEVTARLDVNRLEAIVTNRGVTADWGRNTPGLFYPRGSSYFGEPIPVGSSAGLILGGIVDGSVRIAVGGECFDYHPGPIQAGVPIPFDPRFKNYKIQANATDTYDWQHWPSDLGAPTEANGTPWLLGDQTIWSLYNDATAPWEPEPYSSRAALGIEVRQTTWGISSPGAYGDVVYQVYRLKNASSHEIQGLYAGIHVDPVTYDRLSPLQYPFRGLIACDTTLGLAYAYDHEDRIWYGLPATTLGAMVLSSDGPAAIQDRRWSSSYSGREGQVYATLRGLNPDGTPRHERDDVLLPITPFAYSGDPVAGTGWLYPSYSWASAQFVVSAGPFDLMPGEEQEVQIALIAATGYDRMQAVYNLKQKAAALIVHPAPGPNGTPFAEAGGPYSGFAGIPLEFDGSRSSDPDGAALTYTWRFGDGAIGNGVRPMHTYAAAGIYPVRLSVFDAGLGAEDTTSAHVAPVDSASALLTASGPAVRLFSARPMVVITLEPANGAFAAADIDPSTVTLERADHAAAPIHPMPDKASAPEDGDHDGVAELALAFRNHDLRAMLADLPPGESEVSFWVRGAMVTGGRFAAPLHLMVDAGKKGLAAVVAPNPMNPTAALTFRTRQEGPVRVVLFDVRGRVVRVLLDEPVSAPGYHDVAVGRDASGRDLPSGVYFYRIVTPEGRASGKLVMMK